MFFLRNLSVGQKAKFMSFLFLSVFFTSSFFAIGVQASTSEPEGARIAQVEIPFENPTGFEAENPDLIGGNGKNTGSDQLVGTLKSVVTFLKYGAGIIAFVSLVWSGMRMVSAGDKEDEAKTAQTGVTYSIVALLIIVLIEPLITQTLYGGANGIAPGGQLANPENINAAISAGKRQIIALIQWVEAFTIFLGVGYLIFSGWKFLQDIGGEEEISKQKQVILWMAVGFILIAVDKVLIDQVFYGAILPNESLRVQFIQNPQRGIQEAVGILNYFLQFLAVISVGVMIYAGVMMITSFSNEEGKEKGKKILIGAGIGFLIITGSYILVNSLIMGKVF